MNDIENAHGGGPNEAVHRILEVGLVVSVVLVVIGLLLSLIRHMPLPTTVTAPKEALHLMIVLQPAGYLCMGLLALITTPFLRVVGSLLVFLFERDWLYAGVTAIVFIVMLTSALFGQG